MFSCLVPRSIQLRSPFPRLLLLPLLAAYWFPEPFYYGLLIGCVAGPCCRGTFAGVDSYTCGALSWRLSDSVTFWRQSQVDLGDLLPCLPHTIAGWAPLMRVRPVTPRDGPIISVIPCLSAFVLVSSCMLLLYWGSPLYCSPEAFHSGSLIGRVAGPCCRGAYAGVDSYTCEAPSLR